MSSNRELLERAAKAAGIECTAVVLEGVPHRFGGGYWNPLTDDGDALRLAVELGLDIEFYEASIHVYDDKSEKSFVEEHDGDPYAATRRAIVRAAAEIGRSM